MFVKGIPSTRYFTVSFNQHKGRHYSHFMDDNGDTRGAIAHNNNMTQPKNSQSPFMPRRAEPLVLDQ